VSADPARAQELVRAIDDEPDRLHVDLTPAVNALIELGLPGARAALDVLNAEGELTRLRGQRVLEAVVMRHFGWRAGQGFPDAASEERARAVIAANGPYDAEADPVARADSVERWRSWLAEQDDTDTT
jgi:hypothetical protein